MFSKGGVFFKIQVAIQLQMTPQQGEARLQLYGDTP